MKLTQELSKTELVELYRQMMLIRRFEERASEQYMRGKIRGFLHLYIGEEAIAVGAIPVLADQDYVITHYRDHGHALARGMEPKVIMAELFGRSTGSSKGKGGSMHLFDASRNFMGGYAIVGGQLPLATGLAFAAQYKEEDRIVLCFVGDGALNEGEFHEAMNLAAIWRLPIVFFCENNLYGMGSPVSEVFAVKEIYRAAEPYGIPAKQVDGMDVLAVRDVTAEVADWVRSGNGPTSWRRSPTVFGVIRWPIPANTGTRRRRSTGRPETPSPLSKSICSRTIRSPRRSCKRWTGRWTRRWTRRSSSPTPAHCRTRARSTTISWASVPKP